MRHFSHKKSTECPYGNGESDLHRRCKKAIYTALQTLPGIDDVALERAFGDVRPDVSAMFHGIRVAIEVQISTLSEETIRHRTEAYTRKGIYVLWLLQWTPYLDAQRYSPRLWEKWIHAAYFGRVYYWIKGLTIASYSFQPHWQHVPEIPYLTKHGRILFGGGYTRHSKRFRTPTRENIFNLARDFGPRERDSWSRNGLTVPRAKLFMDWASDSNI